MEHTAEIKTWTSSLLKKLGAVETIIPSVISGTFRNHNTALLLAATIALTGFGAAPVKAATLSDAKAEQALEIVNAQPNTSRISPKPMFSALGRGSSLGTSATRLAAYNRVIDESQSLSTEQKIHVVNDFFNQHINYAQDLKAWGKEDYWATPLETLTKGAGDCEDFAIAKYYALASLGVPVNDMKITYVKSSNFKEAHMVLTVSQGGNGDPLVLDNLVNNVAPLSNRTDLMPVYAFNGQGLFMPNSETVVDGTQRLSKWQAVISRVDAETQLTAALKGAVKPLNLNMGMLKTESVTEAMEDNVILPEVSPVVKNTVRFEPSTPGFS